MLRYASTILSANKRACSGDDGDEDDDDDDDREQAEAG